MSANKLFTEPEEFLKIGKSKMPKDKTCKTCKGYGGYYEDVAGDGGSKMYFECEDCYVDDVVECSDELALEELIASQAKRKK